MILFEADQQMDDRLLAPLLPKSVTVPKIKRFLLIIDDLSHRPVANGRHPALHTHSLIKLILKFAVCLMMEPRSMQFGCFKMGHFMLGFALLSPIAWSLVYSQGFHIATQLSVTTSLTL